MWFLNRVFHHDKYRRSVLLLFVQLDCVQHQFGGPELVGYRAVDNRAHGPGLARLADIGSDSVGCHPDRARFELARLEFVGFEIAGS